MDEMAPQEWGPGAFKPALMQDLECGMPYPRGTAGSQSTEELGKSPKKVSQMQGMVGGAVVPEAQGLRQGPCFPGV